MQKELIKLLQRIASDHKFSDARMSKDEDIIRPEADEYFQKFKAVYRRIGRHRYSEISKYIDSQTPDATDALKNNVRVIIESARKNEYDTDTVEENRECYKKLEKLCDHIELECYRATSLAEIRSLADEYDKKKNEIDKLLCRTDKKAEGVEKKVKGLAQEQISILGIFAGIVVAVAFATSSASGIFADIGKADATYLAFIFFCFGLVFFNVFSLLMFFVGQLSGHEMKYTFPTWVFIGGNAALIIGIVFFYLKMT